MDKLDDDDDDDNEGGGGTSEGHGGIDEDEHEDSCDIIKVIINHFLYESMLFFFAIFYTVPDSDSRLK